MIGPDPIHKETKPAVSIIIPAHNEAGFIGACLTAVLGSSLAPGTVIQIVVVANACHDATAQVVRGVLPATKEHGWALTLIECETPGKLNALNVGEAASKGDAFIYLDADVIVSQDLIAQLVEALDSPLPVYASGTPRVAPANDWLTRAYSRCWSTLPFFREGVAGFGIFAVNAAARRRWGKFPDIISDDTFVRLHFSPSERVRVPATYTWPMVEGFSNLVRVRHRQDEGVSEIRRAYPELMKNETGKRPSLPGLFARFFRDPVAVCSYAVVRLATKTPIARSREQWARGR
ncbi:MAG: glycosyltransferase [Rhodobacter sp.]|nr:glycosyltransferase [Rhodobacter sp.]